MFSLKVVHKHAEDFATGARASIAEGYAAIGRMPSLVERQFVVVGNVPDQGMGLRQQNRLAIHGDLLAQPTGLSHLCSLMSKHLDGSPQPVNPIWYRRHDGSCGPAAPAATGPKSGWPSWSGGTICLAVYKSTR
jgi:hypothetical protein